jgi:hypothetical protein
MPKSLLCGGWIGKTISMINPGKDWAAANLYKPSAFRVYLEIFRAADLVPVGHLSDRDWQEARARLRLGLAVP